MAEYEKKVRKILKENGCCFVRHGKGDHDIWYSPITGKNVAVDSKIKSRHTANEILKQVGIPYKFQKKDEVRAQKERLLAFCKAHDWLVADFTQKCKPLI